MNNNLQERLAACVMAIAAPSVNNRARKLSAFGFKVSPSKQLSCVRDLRCLLHRYRPRHIVELGAGFSTLIFADWCRKVGARLTSVEQNKAWASHVAAIIVPTESIQILVRDVNLDAATRIYDYAVPAEADLVYVDGPANARGDTTKRACLDVARAFDAGIYPPVVAIDGRKLTVDRLLGHSASNMYDWERGGRCTVAVLRRSSNPVAGSVAAPTAKNGG